MRADRIRGQARPEVRNDRRFGGPLPRAGATKRRPTMRAVQVRNRWRRRVLGGLAVLVVGPVLAVAALWPMTPSVDGTEQLVRAHLAGQRASELTVLPRPDRAAQALIATEDSRFFQMPGIDPISVVRMGVALTQGSDTGGATLEQQLVKNLYFPHSDGMVAKVQEAELALKLDARYSKNDVLRMYLADVYFGHGFYGLPAAAEGYFGVAPAGLSWSQASLLAGLVEAPSASDPLQHLSVARLHQRHVLDRLVATHVLSAVQADAALTEPLGLR